MFWNRKNRFEQGLASAETGTAEAIDQLALTVREKLDGEAGEKISSALTNLADQVGDLKLATQVQQSRKEIERATRKARKELERNRRQIANTIAAQADELGISDQVARSRKEIERATKQARKQVEQGSKQIAEIGARTVPDEPSNWVLPTIVGFLLGFGAGFFTSRATSRREQ